MSNNYRRRRSRSNPLMGIIVFLAAAGIFVLLSTTVFFNIETVEVTGASNYSVDEIIAASKINAGDNLVKLNTAKCSENIVKELVYIENAVITRSFPATIVINVEACVPAANFITERGTLLVSRGGKILDTIPEPKAGLLNVYGATPRVDLGAGDMFTSTDEQKDAAIELFMTLLLEAAEKEGYKSPMELLEKQAVSGPVTTQSDISSETTTAENESEIASEDDPEAVDALSEAVTEVPDENNEGQEDVQTETEASDAESEAAVTISAAKDMEEIMEHPLNITSIDVSERSDLSFIYDDRITVKLGAVMDLEYKINFALEIIRKQIGEKTEGVLTILSDAKSASFLDKESLENNARVYSDNLAAMTSAESVSEEETKKEETESKPTQIME